MTTNIKQSQCKWLAKLLLVVMTAVCVLASAADTGYAAGDSFEIETITWEITGTTLLGTMNYHIRKVVAINGIDVNSTSDMDSSYAFCVEPTIVGPEGYGVDSMETYTAGPVSKGGGGEHIYTFNGDEAAEEGYKMMRKLCYYLPSGYGWNKVTKKWWKEYWDSLGGNTNQYNLQSAYALGATVLSRRWGRDADDPEGSANYGYNRIDSAGKALVDRFLTEVKDLPNPPEDYIAFYVQKDNAQDIWGSLYATEYGSIKVKKSSTRKKITDDNDCYDLKDAEFTIYNDKNCTDRAKFKNGNAAILKTKSDGTSDEETIETGDYYILETKAPKGYARDTKAYPITIERNTTYTYTHKDEPITDLVNLLLTKKPKGYPHEKGEGDATLAGAVYEFKYYDGQYNTAAKAEASGDPTATWNLETSANGKISGSDPVTASGYTSSAFYKDKDGNIAFPLGTYVIREVKEPTGYKINNEKIVVHITEDGTDNLHVSTYNESTTSEEEIVRGGVKLSKIDSELDENYAQGDATLKGAEFTVYNQSAHSVMVGDREIAKGDAALVITTDENGFATSDAHALPYGTYSVKETKPSKGYKLNTTWSRNFTIREDGVIIDLTETSVKEDIVRGGLKVTKVDADTGKTTPQGDASIDGAELEIINNSDHDVLVKGTHEDLEDEGQTVTWKHPQPSYEMYKIRTTKAPSKGDKFGFFAQDEVEYEVHIENTGNIVLTMDVSDRFTQSPEFFTISDDMVAKLTDTSRCMMLSIDIEPVPMEEAIREAEQRMLGVETNITNFQRKQNMNNNFSAVIPYDMEQQRRETREFLDDLVANDQRMFYAVITMVHTADTKEQLDSDTKEILNMVRGKLNQMSILRHQQLDGLKTAVPFGTRCINAFRTLITSSLAIFMPFRVQEVRDSGGIYYGRNVISRNLILADRTKLLNGNSFILGVSGGGKSFFAKFEIMILRLLGKADIIIIDPEREYHDLVKALGGSVIEISATSSNHINAMDLSREYSETDPVVEKSQFLQSLCEQIISGHKFSRGQQSIIDRCTELTYRYYKQGNYQGTPPTLQDFRDVLLRQPEPEAQELALELELFTRGSLNTFAKQTNVDTDNSLICYDIFELGEQLRAIGMLVILDSIMNRITQNRQKGRKTFIYIDEIYLLFMHEYSAQFLYKLWKRVRKYGAYCTGITQNVSDLLQSHTARTMLANSEFIVMLNQAATDRIELANLLNISENQIKYITNAEAGHGLMKIGSNLVPFENDFPKNTKLYRLMTSKADEVSEFRKQEEVAMSNDPPDDDKAEFRRKIQEVARNNEGFSDLVDRYLSEAE